MLNPSSPLPLYQQLAELLDRQIVHGELGPGQRLPSEPELARQHRIGRPTVRQATELLVRRGLLERRRGSGTYVRKAPERIDLFSLAGTLSSFRKQGLTPSTRIVQRLRRVAVEVAVDNPFGGRDAYSFARLSRVDDVPVLFERMFFDPEVFRDLHHVPLGSVSVARLVEERYHLRPVRAEQTFRVDVPEALVLGALELPANHAVLLVKRTLDFPAAPQAIFAELFCRTDKLVFSQTLGEGGYPLGAANHE